MFLSIAVTAVVAAGAGPRFDHLKCYKVKDPGTFKTAQADLDALRAEFGIDQGCVIKPRAKIFCTPVAKTVTSIEGGEDTRFDGEEISSDRLCYAIKCPLPAPAAALYSDQLGSRTITFVKTSMLCTPAVAGELPTTTTTLPPCIDSDGDGFGTNCPAGSDCNDNDATVHPGAVEICNGIDDDCNGQTDENVTPPHACATQGVCGGQTIPEICTGAGGWKCNYSEVPSASVDPQGNLTSTESGGACGDGKDNNCNGVVDDGCGP